MSASEGDETTEAIMEATYRALCTHGYADTTIAKIADEFEKSKSLLYYHYENKEELLEDFLLFLLDQLEADLESIDEADPSRELLAVIDRLLPSEVDDDQMRFRRALLEIRAQAPYHELYREQFERSDDLVRSKLIEVIERGIDGGAFRAVNSEAAADFIYSTAYGAIERGVTLDDPEVLDRNREAIESYLDAQLRRYSSETP